MTLRLIVAIILTAILHFPAYCEDEVYMSPEMFIEEAFSGQPPEPQALWLKKEIKPEIKDILGHDYSSFRVRYWALDEKTAWILEEIGKVKPITVGFVVEHEAISHMKVLIYRESHGWEVKYPFFTNQFKGTSLNEKNQLNNNIDGISGATLSVNALRRLSRLALFFDKQVQN